MLGRGLAEDVIILAGTMTSVPGKVTKPLATREWVMEPLTRNRGNLPILAGQGQGRPIPIKILNPTDKVISLRKNMNVGVIKRLLGAEVTSLAAYHVRQTVAAKGAGGYKGVPNLREPLGPELQALVKTGETSLDDNEKDN